MERMISFYLFLFCSSMLLTAAKPTQLRYKQLVKTVNELKKIVKVKDGDLLPTPVDSESKCMSSFKCFQNASSYLEPAKSQSSNNFNTMIRRLKKPITTNNIIDMNCSLCESYAKEAPSKFLDSFLSLLQEQIRNLNI